MQQLSRGCCSPAGLVFLSRLGRNNRSSSSSQQQWYQIDKRCPQHFATHESWPPLDLNLATASLSSREGGASSVGGPAYTMLSPAISKQFDRQIYINERQTADKLTGKHMERLAGNRTLRKTDRLACIAQMNDILRVIENIDRTARLRGLRTTMPLQAVHKAIKKSQESAWSSGAGRGEAGKCNTTTTTLAAPAASARLWA